MVIQEKKHIIIVLMINVNFMQRKKNENQMICHLLISLSHIYTTFIIIIIANFIISFFQRLCCVYI